MVSDGELLTRYFFGSSFFIATLSLNHVTDDDDDDDDDDDEEEEEEKDSGGGTGLQWRVTFAPTLATDWITFSGNFLTLLPSFECFVKLLFSTPK